MDDSKSTSSRKGAGMLRERDLQPEERPVRETWSDAGELSRGGVSANDTSKVRDDPADEGTEKVVAGFTNTSPTGSMGGRAFYGEEPESERDAEADEEAR